MQKVVAGLFVLGLGLVANIAAAQSSPDSGVNPQAAPSATTTSAVASTPASPAVVPGDDVNQRICRKVETLGTRLKSRKICRTAAEWRAIESNSRREVEGVQNRGGNGQSPKMGS